MTSSQKGTSKKSWSPCIRYPYSNRPYPLKKQTNQPLCLRNQSTLKRNACGSSKINSCFYCSLNRWYKVIYNHPIGRKNATNIYHLYRQKSPVFFHPPLAPRGFFLNATFFIKPCEVRLVLWPVVKSCAEDEFSTGPSQTTRGSSGWEKSGNMVFSSKRVVNGPQGNNTV